LFRSVSTPTHDPQKQICWPRPNVASLLCSYGITKQGKGELIDFEKWKHHWQATAEPSNAWKWDRRNFFRSSRCRRLNTNGRALLTIRARLWVASNANRPGVFQTSLSGMLKSAVVIIGGTMLSLSLASPAKATGSLTLAWDPVLGPDIAGYRLLYGPSSGNYDQQIDAGNKTVATIPNLEDGGTYFLVVTAYTAVGMESPPSNEVSATVEGGPNPTPTPGPTPTPTAAPTPTPAGTPAAPTNLLATAISSSQIALSWTDHSTIESGFQIYRSRNGVTFGLLATVPANVTTHTDNGLAPITTYYYRVQAYNSRGNSALSNVTSAKTLPGSTPTPTPPLTPTPTATPTSTPGFTPTPTPTLTPVPTPTMTPTATPTPTPGQTPAAPTNLLAAAISSSQIALSWTDNSTNETGFQIQRSNDGMDFALVATVNANVTTYTDGALTAGTTYYYQLRAYNSRGGSGLSNMASARTLLAVTPTPTPGSTPSPTPTATPTPTPTPTPTATPTPTPAQAPAAPTNLLAAAISSSQIALSWTDNSTNETGFQIQRSSDGITFALVATVGTNVTTYTDNGRTPGTMYYYRVRAYNSGGNSALSNVANASTPSSGPTL
jgi:fibronectin type 3 domain-containing protein